MRVILDTNIIISGIFFSGPPYQILEAWYNKKLKIVLSPEIYKEYVQVADRLSFKYKDIDISRILELIAVESELYHPIELPKDICRDPHDVKFISCALSSNTKVIVSGDKDLLELNGISGIEILSPHNFVKKYLE